MSSQCVQCRATFEITTEDLAFYDKISPVISGKTLAIPPPTLCPDCRQQRRMSFRNERKLYHRACAKTGKDMISVYSPDKPHTVYSGEAWWSDGWDPMAHGRDVDFSRPFFEQLGELVRDVPHLGNINVECVNSDYANQCGWSKDCYMVFVTDFSEHCSYTDYCISSRHCIDCSGLQDCDLCYGCLDCVQCYHVFFSQDCSNCSDSSFCSFCKGCKNCFGCTGLRNKEYHIYNEPVSREEWERRKKEWAFTPESIAAYDEKARRLKLQLPHPHTMMVNCQDCTGNYLTNSKNAIHCFDGKDMEDCKDCIVVPLASKDCRDSIGCGGELCYEVFSTGPAYRAAFCWHCWKGVADLLYCAFCMNQSKNLFGCVGLRKAEYCILNKQYTREGYEALVPKLVEHMRGTGEWGEFFPSSLSPFGYDETIANDFYPLAESEARARGFHWSSYEAPKPAAPKVIPAAQVPASIRDTPDDILQWAIECEATGLPYRLTKHELTFYREQSLPVPRLHPEERYRRRIARRNPRKLWSRECAKCRSPIETSYAPDRPEVVYCEKCYLETVY